MVSMEETKSSSCPDPIIACLIAQPGDGKPGQTHGDHNGQVSVAGVPAEGQHQSGGHEGQHIDDHMLFGGQYSLFHRQYGNVRGRIILISENGDGIAMGHLP